VTHALADAQAPDATASATARGAGGALFYESVTAATASGEGAASAESSLLAGSGSLAFASGVSAASLAILQPDAATTAAALDGDARVAAQLDRDGAPLALSLFTLGGGTQRIADGGSVTSSATLSLSIAAEAAGLDPDTGALHLALGLLDPQLMGDGFVSAALRITLEDRVVVDRTFADVNDALSFFDDGMLDLGAVTPEVVSFPYPFPFPGPLLLPIDIEIALDVTSAGGGDGFFATMLLARATVPEPGTLVLLGIGVGLLGRRKGNGPPSVGTKGRRFDRSERSAD